MPSIHARVRHVLVALSVAAGVLGTGTSAATGTCDHLVTHGTGHGSSGDLDAVAITAQTLERGTAGWTSVGWAPADGVRLEAVEVHTPTGPRTPPTGATSATGPVLAVTFCGASDTRGHRHVRPLSLTSRTADDPETRP